jgi:cytochrome c oxidase cbb3-type subunit 3
MDEKWVYGSDPANIFSAIVEGRPNGMPSFRGKIPDNEVWELVAYVRSLSGQVRKDVASGRGDEMYGTSAEQSTKKEQPKNSGLPKSAEQTP